MQPELFREEQLQDGKRLDDEHALILKYCKDNALDPTKAEDYARAMVAVIPYTQPDSLKES